LWASPVKGFATVIVIVIVTGAVTVVVTAVVKL
jgi:preprotein translocase subunit SecD